MEKQLYVDVKSPLFWVDAACSKFRALAPSEDFFEHFFTHCRLLFFNAIENNSVDVLGAVAVSASGASSPDLAIGLSAEFEARIALAAKDIFNLTVH